MECFAAVYLLIKILQICGKISNAALIYHRTLELSGCIDRVYFCDFYVCPTFVLVFNLLKFCKHSKMGNIMDL